MQVKKYFQNIDYWLVIAMILLCLIGLVAIASATRINLGETTTLVEKQTIFIGIGLVLMMISANVDLQNIARFHVLIYLFNLGLLGFVLVLGSGANGAVRWIPLPGGMTIQPSEFAKVMMIFSLSVMFQKYRHQINTIQFLVGITVYIALPILLIQIQPALSASLVLLAIFCIMIFVAGLSYKIIQGILFIGVPIVGFILYDVSQEVPWIMDEILQTHQFNRILSFVDPTRDTNLYYQTAKSISAIGSGQWEGQGWFNGTLNQLSYLPEPHNDFIFSVIGEEFGFLGCSLVLVLQLFIIFRCVLVATRTRDLFFQLIVSGVGGMLAFQTFVNTGVALGLVPNTGMSLPFVGYGGSAMWTSMIAIGMVLNIRKREAKSIFEGGF